MSLNRRAILALLGSAPVAAGISARDISDASKRALPPPAPPTPMVISDDDLLRRNRWEILNRLRSEIGIQSEATRAARGGQMPPSIAGMRSWSPAFKEHVFVTDFIEVNRVLRRVLDLDIDDAEAIIAIAEMLGVGVDNA